MYLEGVVIAENSGSTCIVSVTNAASAHIDFSTLVNNSDRLSAISTFDGPAGEPLLNVRSSIVDEDSGDVLGGDDNLDSSSTLDCLISHESGSFSGTRITVPGESDPLFADRAGGNYHLSRNSIAIDYCDDSVAVPQFGDIDNETRGLDMATANLYGPFDLGADELPDRIFRDRFEGP